MSEWREAFCPLCGRTMGMRTVYRSPGKPYFGIAGRENKWDLTREFTGEKPFGVVKSSEGKGTLKTLRYYEIDEDVEGFFPPMKARLLAILGEWQAKGLITREEVEGALS